MRKRYSLMELQWADRLRIANDSNAALAVSQLSSMMDSVILCCVTPPTLKRKAINATRSRYIDGAERIR